MGDVKASIGVCMFGRGLLAGLFVSGAALLSMACTSNAVPTQQPAQTRDAVASSPAHNNGNPTSAPTLVPIAPSPTPPPEPVAQLPHADVKPSPVSPATPVPATPVPTIIATSTPRPNPTPVPTKVPLEYGIREKLVLYVPRINDCDKDDQHRRVIDAAVVQIRDDIYGNGFASDEKLAWEYISKAIGFLIPQLCVIDVNEYSFMDLRQILLPRELRTIDIVRVMNERGINYETQGLAIGLKNVTKDDRSGKSPQEWLEEMMKKDYNSSGSVDALGYNNYIRALNNLTRGAESWPQNNDSFQRVVEERKMRGQTLPLFVNGWTIFRIGEQTADVYGVLAARTFRPPIAAYSIRAKYPNKTGIYYPEDAIGTHTELGIKNNGSLFHFWMDKQAFLSAYKGALNRPKISLHGPDGKVYDPYEFN